LIKYIITAVLSSLVIRSRLKIEYSIYPGLFNCSSVKIQQLSLSASSVPVQVTPKEVTLCCCSTLWFQVDRDMCSVSTNWA